jgi:HSP20 family molecular chaperone IbpA
MTRIRSAQLQAELTEKDMELEARIALPGFDPKDIRVGAAPYSLVAKAETARRHDRNIGRVPFREISGKKLFRRIYTPAGIDVDSVSASLD